MKHPPLRALDSMNAICCLLVILIHVLSIGISYADPTSWQAMVIYFPWRLISFVVPAFLFTGAVKLGRSGGRGHYFHYISARIKAVYLPYLLWTAIYYISFIPVGYVRGDWSEFLHYVLTGSITSPFYYIIIVMQFYLLRPLWLWMLRKIPWFVAVTAAVPITLFFAQSSALLSMLGIQFNYISSLAGSYLLFWVIGLYVGQHYEAVEETLMTHKVAVFSLIPIVLVAAGLSYVQHRSGLYLYPLDYFKLFVDCIDIAILLVLCVLIGQYLPKIQGVLQWIHRSSFFVYLSHCLFLTHITIWAEGQDNFTLLQLLLLRGAVCFSIPFLLYWFWSCLTGKCYGQTI